MLGLSLAACGTKATGVEECRQIELARCQSAQQCGLIEDVDACERYIVDECRHGFPADLGPSGSSVSACVKAIVDVGVCAERSGKKTAPADCGRSSLTSAKADRVCELVEHPEDLPKCSFLAESSQSEESDEEAEAEAGADPEDSPGDEAEAGAATSDAAP